MRSGSSSASERSVCACAGAACTIAAANTTIGREQDFTTFLFDCIGVPTLYLRAVRA
jgi:hypothetical protein